GGGDNIVQGRAEFVSVYGELIGQERERGKSERRGDDPLPRHPARTRDLAHDRLAEAEREGSRRDAREKLVRATLGRFEIRRREKAHAVFPLTRAAMRTLSAARARCRCVFTVPSGMPRVSATS